MEVDSAHSELPARPDLSVVIGTIGVHDPARTIASVLRSADGTQIPVEVIVAWQGHDLPPAHDDPRVRSVDVFPLSLSYARNRGLAEARAPLVGFVDDDEVVDDGWVGAAVAVFDGTREATGAFGPVAPLDEIGRPSRADSGEGERVFRGRTIAPWFVGTGGNMAFRTADLVRAGGFDLRFGAGAAAHAAEEWDLIVRLLRDDRTLVWSPELRVYHPTKSEAEELASRFPYGFGCGQLARRRRYPSLALRYSKAIAEVLVGAVRRRDRRRLREGLGTLHGFCAGLASRARPLSPLAAIDRMPDSLRAQVGDVTWAPLELLVDGGPKLRYRGGGAHLVVYLNPAADLGRELDGRADVEFLAPGRDSLWSLGSS